MGDMIFGAVGLVMVLLMLGVAAWAALSGRGRTAKRRLTSGRPILPPHEEICPSCGAVIRREVKGRCAVCGYALETDPQKRPRSELDATERQINRWHRSGQIDSDQWRQLQGLVRQERAMLSAPAPKPRPSSEPVAPPPLPVRKPRPEEPPARRVTERIAPRMTPPSVPAADSKEAEVVSAPTSTPSATPVPTPTRPLGNLLQAFMEEKNIRWGELVSGVLIVGSAVGLVISLWATLKDRIPYFPALLFLAVTGGLCAAGLYTLRRWKLRSTSHGLLLISTLLVPLNFLAGIAVSDEQRTDDWLYVTAIGVGVVAFGAISVLSARVLLRRRWIPLVIGVMGPSIGQLVISRYASPTSLNGDLTWMASIGFLSFLVALAGPLRLMSVGRHLTQRRVSQMFLLLGASLFSLAVPVGLLVWKTKALAATLAVLSPWLSAAAGVALCAGLIVHRRLVSPLSTTTRTAGTALAIISALAMIGPVVLAWPQPDLLLAVGLVNFALLTGLAFVGRMPVLHVPAVAAAGLVSLVTFHLYQGQLTFDATPRAAYLIDVLTMGRSGVVLLVLAAIASLAAGLLQKLGRKADALGYLCGAAAVGVASTSIAVYAGFVTGVDGELATLVFAVTALAVLTAATQMRHAAVAWLGSGLLLVALAHGLEWNPAIQNQLAQLGATPARPLVVAALLHATLMTVLVMSSWARSLVAREIAPRTLPDGGCMTPWMHSALLSTLLALPVIVGGTHLELVASHAGYAGWTALLWLCCAFVRPSRLLPVASQALGTFAVVLAATAVSRRMDWWSGDVFAAQHIQMQLGSLAIWCSIWPAVRVAVRPMSHVHNVLTSVQPTVDRIVLAGVVTGVLGVSLIDCLPGIAEEFRTTGAVETVPPVTTLILVVFCGLTIGLLAALQSVEGRNSALAIAGLVFVALTTFVLPLPAGTWLSRDGPFFIEGAGAWLVLGLVATGLLVALRERVSLEGLSSLLVVGATGTLLIAARFYDQAAVATALRWSLASYGLSIAITLCGRKQLGVWAGRFGWRVSSDEAHSLGPALRTVAIGVTVLPLLALSLRPVFELVAGNWIAGPESGSLFARIGPGWSFAGPCWVLTLSLIAYTIRDNLSSYALAGSLLTQLGLSLAVTLPTWLEGETVGTLHLARLLQTVAIGFGVYGVIWIAVLRWFDPDASIQPPGLDDVPTALAVHQWLAVGTMLVLPLWAAIAIFITPHDLPQHLGSLGSWLGFLAVAVVVASWSFYARKLWPRSIVETACGAAIASVPLIAAAYAAFDIDGNWLSYHILAGGWCALAVGGAVFIAVTVLRSDKPVLEGLVAQGEVEPPPANKRYTAIHWSDPAIRWVLLAGALVVVLAIRGVWQDPGHPWWSAWTTFFIAAAVGTVAVRLRSQPLAYETTLLLMLSAAFVWMRPWIGFEPVQTPQHWVDLMQAILVAASLAGFFWLLVTLYFQRENDQEFDPSFSSPPVHHTAAIGTLVLAALLTLGGLALRTLAITFGGSGPIDVSNPGGWLMIGTLTLLISVSVWDRTAKHAVGALYLLGLVALAIDLDAFELATDDLLFAAGLAATGYVMLTGMVWTQRVRILDFADAMSMPRSTLDPTRIASWLPTANVALAGFGVFVEFWVALTFDDWRFRVAAATGVALSVPGFAALAQDERRERMQYLSLMSAAVAAVCFGWATMPVSGAPDYWLQRAVRLMVMLAASASVYGIVLVRVLPALSAWYRSTWRATVSTGAASLLSLLAVLILEGVWYDPATGAPLTAMQIAVVSVVLVGLAGALVSLSLLPGADPLKLSQRGRMLYVYAAEAVLSLLFLHIRLAMPELFRGYLLPYWPFIVMAIAFCGVGLGEVFQRRGTLVLAEPLQRTGAFLPLLPAIGFWAHMSQSDSPVVGDYSTLLFIGGLLYVVLSMWRKSFVYSLAAAIAGNGGLWALLSEQDLTLLSRPQLWLIPPALSVLVAAQLNRRVLNEVQLTTIRYLAVTVIYASSTGEMFLTGVGESLWLPMVLATLSVCGVLAGMLLKVRAFLYLGSSFLLLSIISMVWHAAQNIGHVWPWWAFGIALGLAILTLFGMFEKKRSEMERVVADLRQWER